MSATKTSTSDELVVWLAAPIHVALRQLLTTVTPGGGDCTLRKMALPMTHVSRRTPELPVASQPMPEPWSTFWCTTMPRPRIDVSEPMYDVW